MSLTLNLTLIICNRAAARCETQEMQRQGLQELENLCNRQTSSTPVPSLMNLYDEIWGRGVTHDRHIVEMIRRQGLQHVTLQHDIHVSAVYEHGELQQCAHRKDCI